MPEKPKLGLGLIGSGFMGKAHVFGFATAARVFKLPFDVEMTAIADVTQPQAEAAGAALGFSRATGNWRELIDDPAIDLIDITAPNSFHKEMALAAIAAGKHVYCEKPLAPLAADAFEMAHAAEAADRRTQVGFNYLCNPLLATARQMIADGELGEVLSYRGVHAEDYMADPKTPWSFRHDPAGGGALADIGSHALATAEYLLGPVVRVLGDCVTMIRERPDGRGARRPVRVDDIGRAFLRFSSGVSGQIEANWLAQGRKMQHDFEVYGTRGALSFSQERMNELHFYATADAPGRRGFRRIETAPEHPPYGRFCVAAGHHLGFNDLKAIEVAGFLDAIAGRGAEPFNFRKGAGIQRLVECIHVSAREGGWRDVPQD